MEPLNSFTYCPLSETGWLEPLLDRIVDNPASVVAPMIAGINMETFRFEPHRVRAGIPYGIFKLDLTFTWKWLFRKKAEFPGKKMVEPVRFVISTCIAKIHSCICSITLK